MRLSYGSEVSKRHIGYAFTNIRVPFGYEIERLFERYLDIVRGVCLLLVGWFCEGESDVSPEIFPLGVILFDRLVIQTEVIDNDLFDALRIGALQSQVEKATFLRQEPLSKLLVPAVGQTANEVRNVVILTAF